MSADRQSHAQVAIARARHAQQLLEAEPVPVRDILNLLILAVIALAHAVAKLDDAQKGRQVQS